MLCFNVSLCCYVFGRFVFLACVLLVTVSLPLSELPVLSPSSSSLLPPPVLTPCSDSIPPLPLPRARPLAAAGPPPPPEHPLPSSLPLRPPAALRLSLPLCTLSPRAARAPPPFAPAADVSPPPPLRQLAASSQGPGAGYVAAALARVEGLKDGSCYGSDSGSGSPKPRQAGAGPEGLLRGGLPEQRESNILRLAVAALCTGATTTVPPLRLLTPEWSAALTSRPRAPRLGASSRFPAAPVATAPSLLPVFEHGDGDPCGAPLPPASSMHVLPSPRYTADLLAPVRGRDDLDRENDSGESARPSVEALRGHRMHPLSPHMRRRRRGIDRGGRAGADAVLADEMPLTTLHPFRRVTSRCEERAAAACGSSI